ncbi:zinc-binding dehydrogenase [Rubrobacter tropicus]|uniref:Zinc-binding dehydrogenase n=1 Tax=Rubrobacter tropicus TaxID=2653851 RepID=A0A6G8QCT9_9ACTN|nr:alcohol dehydrogenase family protein [Rubrobacter tropicus]QIN84077.1 zinc-binding dehydrogenase [Rubrobacter tropicus]
MKAVLLTGHGGPEKLEYREDVPAPEPAAGEVLIEVGAAGVNNTDLWTREGAYGAADDPEATGGWRRGEAMGFPRIQGMDVAGRIVAVGDGVAGTRVGERVLVDPTLYAGEGNGLIGAGFIGSERDGGFAEYVAVPAGNAHPVGSALGDEELATFPTAYVTAQRMLKRARLKSGETVLVTGASGGVGSALVQLAKARGAYVVAVAGPGKEERVREIGADAVLARGTPDLPAAASEASGGRPIDAVADVVGGDSFAGLLNALRPEGRYVVAGAIAGPSVGLDLRTVYLNHLEIIGSTMGTREDFADVVRHVTDGRVRPLLAGVYPLRDLGRAQEDFGRKSFFGKLVVVPR